MSNLTLRPQQRGRNENLVAFLLFACKDFKTFSTNQKLFRKGTTFKNMKNL